MTTPYATSYSPTPRDYALDYEAVLTSVSDVVRMARFLRRGDVVVPNEDPTGVPTTKEDVVMVLRELRQMLNRMFNRFRLA